MSLMEPWLVRWSLEADGAEIVTSNSRLLPVRYAGRPAMLKIAIEDEERHGAELLTWWQGIGAVEVLAQEGPALLIARAAGTRSLAAMARAGDDAEAARIICDVAARLHTPRGRAPPAHCLQIARWFEALWPVARRERGLLAEGARHARALLDGQYDIVVLHGDLHHDNVLDFGARGWLAIDPKGLIGEPAFDCANLFRNPDEAVALKPGRLSHLADVVADTAGLDRRRLLQWVLSLACLSAAWGREAGKAAALDLAVAKLALKELNR